MTTVVIGLIAVLLAGILVYALRLKRDVKFSIRVLGANVVLEARDTREQTPPEQGE